MKLLSKLKGFFARGRGNDDKARRTAAATAISKMLRGSRTPYGPDDPQLTAATLALAQPLFNGPKLSAVQDRARNIEARFDNAQYDEGTRKHWAMADYLGPDAAANPGVRYILRIRSRYEVANNSYARGIVTTIANDTIGRGPRLHMLSADVDVNRAVQAKFSQWAKEIDLAGKLRTMRMAKCQDGEAFCVQANRTVTREHVERGGCPVALNPRVFEADQCATVSAMQFSVPSVDGIELDEHFQPKNYFILRIHPGNYVYLPGYVGFPWDYDTFPAQQVCHWFRKDRPELHRGIPEITPALNLFAQLRDFTASVLKSARIQSAWAISIETNAPAGTEPVQVAPMDTFDFEDGMAMTMPYGWKANGFNPTNPPAAYANFKRELLCEIGRCLNMPLCVIAGDSSGYNYASGRLDFQVYHKSIEVDRSECELAVLDKIFYWWIQEAVLIEGYLPQTVRRLGADLSHQWMWDAEEHVDPTKEAGAAQTRLGTLTTNLAIEWAKNGIEWEAGLEQIARERAKMKELGIPVPLPPNQSASNQPQEPDDDGSLDPEDLKEAQAEYAAALRAGPATLAPSRRIAKRAILAAEQPRGKSSPESNGGSFAPKKGGDAGQAKKETGAEKVKRFSNPDPGLTSAQQETLMRELVTADPAMQGKPKPYRLVDAAEAKRLRDQTTLDLAGCVHTAAKSEINKILDRHGPGKEWRKDHAPITEDDIALVPQIVANPDSSRLLPPQPKQKYPHIEHKKRVNGHIFVVEEVRMGKRARKQLALKSMHKIKVAPPVT